MKMLKHLFILLLFIAFAAVAQTTVELQNGLNGYTGCEDSYLLFMQGILFAEEENIDVYYDSAQT